MNLCERQRTQVHFLARPHYAVCTFLESINGKLREYSVCSHRYKKNLLSVCCSESVGIILGRYLSSIGGGEDPHCPSALFDVPEEPESRHLVGFRGHVYVDKQCGEATSSSGRDYMEGKKSLNTACTPVTFFIFCKSEQSINKSPCQGFLFACPTFPAETCT